MRRAGAPGTAREGVEGQEEQESSQVPLASCRVGVAVRVSAALAEGRLPRCSRRGGVTARNRLRKETRIQFYRIHLQIEVKVSAVWRPRNRWDSRLAPRLGVTVCVQRGFLAYGLQFEAGGGSEWG